MYKMYLQDSEFSQLLDITDICNDIQWSTSILAQRGKLTFTIQKDPNNLVTLRNGDVVIFYSDIQNETFPIIAPKKDSKQYGFKGSIFSIKMDQQENYSVTCYDQLRYLQNHDYLNFGPIEKKYLTEDGTEETIKEGNKVRDFFELIMTQAGFENYKVETLKIDYFGNRIPDDSDIPVGGEQLPQKVFYDVSYFEMFQWMIETCLSSGIEKTFENASQAEKESYEILASKGILNSHYYVYDNFGTITLSRLKNEVTDLVIGDGSLMTEFNYERSIEDLINEVIITTSYKRTLEEKESGMKNTEAREIVDAKQDVESVNRYGRLREIINIRNQTEMGINPDTQKEYTQEEWIKLAKDYMELYLKVHDRQKTSLKIKALGYDGIVAGKGVNITIGKLKLNEVPMYVKTVTHSYSDGVHMMDLEVAWDN